MPILRWPVTWGGQWQRPIGFDCWNHFSTLLCSISSVVNTIWWWLIWNENIFTLRMHFHMSIYISLPQSFFYLILYFSLQSPDQSSHLLFMSVSTLTSGHCSLTWSRYLDTIPKALLSERISHNHSFSATSWWVCVVVTVLSLQPAKLIHLWTKFRMSSPCWFVLRNQSLIFIGMNSQAQQEMTWASGVSVHTAYLCPLAQLMLDSQSSF